MLIDAQAPARRDERGGGRLLDHQRTIRDIAGREGGAVEEGAGDRPAAHDDLARLGLSGGTLCTGLGARLARVYTRGGAPWRLRSFLDTAD